MFSRSPDLLKVPSHVGGIVTRESRVLLETRSLVLSVCFYFVGSRWNLGTVFLPRWAGAPSRTP